MKKIILFIAFGLLQWSLISCVYNDDDFGPDTEILKEYELSVCSKTMELYARTYGSRYGKC